MCMNCGCGEPNDDRGKPENITLDVLQRAAGANDQTVLESAEHILEAAQLAVHEPRGDVGLARPAASSGAANAGSEGGHGTPASES